ncbi:hypothetical protein NFI96_031114 [Prochilodus magdalenae]|nr:hypothetical protein NFI96_031114 [Prochilodus magdalenae]
MNPITALTPTAQLPQNGIINILPILTIISIITTTLIPKRLTLSRITIILMLMTTLIMIPTLTAHPILNGIIQNLIIVPNLTPITTTTTRIHNPPIIIPIRNPTITHTRSLTTTITMIIQNPINLILNHITIPKQNIIPIITTTTTLIIPIMNPIIIMNIQNPFTIPILNLPIILAQNLTTVVRTLKHSPIMSTRNPTTYMSIQAPITSIPILNPTTNPMQKPITIHILGIIQNLIIITPRIITIMRIIPVLFATLQLASVPPLLILASQIPLETPQALPVMMEKGSELEKIMCLVLYSTEFNDFCPYLHLSLSRMLQEQNEDLHNTLRQTAVRMECLGAEFITGHQLLESELQRTRVELGSMMDKFIRLQDNYSSTQQTNHLLEKKLHCVAESMDEEREKLNHRISELTEQLSAAKTTIQSLETINVTSMLQDALVKHFKSDDPLKPFKPPVAPPPLQFMDSDHYDKDSVTGDEQSLGPLPEEEESDWSEMGDETQHCGLRSLEGGHHCGTAFFPWRQGPGRVLRADQYGRGDGDTESESGGEEVARGCGLQIPHLQFTIHPETLPVPLADASLSRFKQSLGGPGGESHHFPPGRHLGSPIRILSASLEGINSTGLPQHEHHGQLKCTEGMMDLHRPQGGAAEDSDEEELVRNWKRANKQDSEGGGKGGKKGGLEPVGGLESRESAQRMLNHFIQGGERTQL